MNNPVKLIDPNGEWPWEPTNVKDARKYARQTGESFEKYKVGGQTYDSVRVENTSTTPAENTPVHSLELRLHSRFLNLQMIHGEIK